MIFQLLFEQEPTFSFIFFTSLAYWFSLFILLWRYSKNHSNDNFDNYSIEKDKLELFKQHMQSIMADKILADKIATYIYYVNRLLNTNCIDLSDVYRELENREKHGKLN